MDGTIMHNLLPDVPYAHPRSIIANFDTALVTLKKFLPKTLMKKLFSSSALLQVMGLPEDGLNRTWKMSLTGAWLWKHVANVILFDQAGNVLTKAELPPQHHMTIIKILLVIIIMAVIASTWFWRFKCCGVLSLRYYINKD